MADVILHHYEISPYSEKVRRILAFKGIAWKSVIIPIIAPKPDLVSLTGGYRKTPVLQIGADVYCDTDCIARALDRLKPEPTLYPRGSAALEHMLTGFQAELFMRAIYATMAAGGGEGGESPFPDGFFEDRQTMFEGGLDVVRLLRQLPAYADQLRAKLALVDALFSDGRAFALGAEVSLADFSLHHPLWILQRNPATAPLLAPWESTRAWLTRMDRFGPGSFETLDSKTAIEIARAATPATAVAEDPADPNGRKPGDRVSVVHESFGMDPVEGELVASEPDEIAVRRTDERAGSVVVHLPRQHYMVTTGGS